MTQVPLHGLLLLVLLTLGWGSNWPAMKTALREIDPWTFRAICLVVGGAALLAVARARGESLAIARDERRPLAWVSLFNVSGWHLCSAYGLTLIGAGRASIIAFTMPLWAALIDRALFKEPLTRGRVVALALGLAGLAILIVPDLAKLRAAPAGALFMLAAAVSWATGTLLVKRSRWAMSTTVLTGWQVALGAIPILPGMLLLEDPRHAAGASPAAWVATAYATFVGVVVCHYLWFYLVRLLPAAVVSIGVLGVPVVGVFSSALVIGEAVGWREVAALACILPALAMVLIGPVSIPDSPPPSGRRAAAPR
jgi:drug/metabolite transporter (DMT)-like permease